MEAFQVVGVKQLVDHGRTCLSLLCPPVLLTSFGATQVPVAAVASLEKMMP
jgi:hypothetical protein